MTPDPLSVLEMIYASVTVYDEQGLPVEGALVSARPNYLPELYTRSGLTDASGKMYFPELVAGVVIDFRASKAGYSSRSYQAVLKSNKSMICNCYAIGIGPDPYSFDGGEYAPNALSRRPDVNRVVPERRSMLADAGKPIVLGFSRPMQPESVEDNFQLRVATGARLSVDDRPSFSGATNEEQSDGELLFDRQAFEIVWNAEQTELSLRFRPGWQWPVDRDFTRNPVYRISLDGGDGLIRSADGFERTNAVFKLTDGNFETGYEFIPQADLSPPGLDKAEVASKARPGLKLSFSEALRVRTLAGPIGAGMKAAAEAPAEYMEQGVSAQAAAENYFLTLRRSGRLLLSRVSWASLSGTARFDPEDPSFRTVWLGFVRAEDFERRFEPGDELTIEVADTVSDPAGNRIDEAHRRVSLVMD